MCNTTAFVDPPAYAFSAREISRLAIYRAAVQAGFFSDTDIPGDTVHPTEEKLPMPRR
jgi:hypothetical protein